MNVLPFREHVDLGIDGVRMSRQNRIPVQDRLLHIEGLLENDPGSQKLGPSGRAGQWSLVAAQVSHIGPGPGLNSPASVMFTPGRRHSSQRKTTVRQTRTPPHGSSCLRWTSTAPFSQAAGAIVLRPVTFPWQRPNYLSPPPAPRPTRHGGHACHAPSAPDFTTCPQRLIQLLGPGRAVARGAWSIHPPRTA